MSTSASSALLQVDLRHTKRSVCFLRSRALQKRIRKDVHEIRASVHFASTLAVAELVLSAAASAQQQHPQPASDRQQPRLQPRQHHRPPTRGPHTNMQSLEPQRGSESRPAVITFQKVPSELDTYSTTSRAAGRRPTQSGSGCGSHDVIIEEVDENNSWQSPSGTNWVSPRRPAVQPSPDMCH